MSSVEKRVYYDSNVWIAYIMGNGDHFYSVCEPLIEDVRQGRCTCVVSNLIMLESINVIRKRITEKQLVKDNPDPSAVEALAEEHVKKCIRLVRRLEQQKKIAFIESTEYVVEQDIVLGKLQTLTDYVNSEQYCNVCKEFYQSRDIACPTCGASIKPTTKYRYSGLGHSDLEHAYLALYGRASVFYTTDKGFKNLATDPDFASIAFKQL